MENRGYSIYEVGILGGNDKGEIKFVLFYFLCSYYLLGDLCAKKKSFKKNIYYYYESIYHYDYISYSINRKNY